MEVSVFDYTKCFKTEPVEEQLSGSNQVVHYSIIYGKETNFEKKALWQVGGRRLNAGGPSAERRRNGGVKRR